MHYGRYDYSATTMAGKIYVAGGKADENLCLYSVECYDPDEDIWTKVTNMIHARANFALVESKGMLYAMGYHKCIERYDPTRDVWTVVRRKLKRFNLHFSFDIFIKFPSRSVHSRTANILHRLLICTMTFTSR